MPPLTYYYDRDMVGRVKDLEDRLKALERGGVLRPSSPKVRLNSSIAGAWPQSVSFTSTNTTSTILVLWQITAYNTATGAITATLQIDGTTQDTATMVTSVINTHECLPFGAAVVVGLTATSHTAQVSLTAGNSDGNDRGRILILEIP